MGGSTAGPNDSLDFARDLPMMAAKDVTTGQAIIITNHAPLVA